MKYHYGINMVWFFKETTLQQRPVVSNYKSSHGLRQWVKREPHSMTHSNEKNVYRIESSNSIKGSGMTNVKHAIQIRKQTARLI